jgi:SAM-dependent methyltransferase
MAYAAVVEEHHRESADKMGSLLKSGRHDPSAFRAELLSIPPMERDVWLDRVLGIVEIPPDGPELPRGCAPYLPCSVDVLLRLVASAPVQASDVFVDVGSGMGRAAAMVHLLTGASAIGLEIQRELVRSAREMVSRFGLSRISFIEGDAVELTANVPHGSVYFLYCPFSDGRLSKLLQRLEPIARNRAIRLCCLDLPLPACAWLAREPNPGAHDDLAIHRGILHNGAPVRPDSPTQEVASHEPK